MQQDDDPPSGEDIVDLARRLFGPANGVDLNIPSRGSAPSRPPPDFSGPDWAYLDEPAQGATGAPPHPGKTP